MITKLLIQISLLLILGVFCSCEEIAADAQGKQNGNKLVVALGNVSGLELGDKVFSNGLEIGEISKMEIAKDGSKVYVSAEIQKQINIPMNSDFYFITTDLLGTKGIEVVYSNASEYYQHLDTVSETEQERNTSNIDSLLVEFLNVWTKEDSIKFATRDKDQFFNEVMKRVTDSLMKSGVIHKDSLHQQVELR